MSDASEHRFVYEFGIDVLDEVKLRAFAGAGLVRDETGQLSGVTGWDLDTEISGLLVKVFGGALQTIADEAGFRVAGGGWPQPRRRNEAGGWAAVELPRILSPAEIARLEAGDELE